MSVNTLPVPEAFSAADIEVPAQLVNWCNLAEPPTNISIQQLHTPTRTNQKTNFPSQWLRVQSDNFGSISVNTLHVSETFFVTRLRLRLVCPTLHIGGQSRFAIHRHLQSNTASPHTDGPRKMFPTRKPMDACATTTTLTNISLCTSLQNSAHWLPISQRHQQTSPNKCCKFPHGRPGTKKRSNVRSHGCVCTNDHP